MSARARTAKEQAAYDEGYRAGVEAMINAGLLQPKVTYIPSLPTTVPNWWQYPHVITCEVGSVGITPPSAMAFN